MIKEADDCFCMFSLLSHCRVDLNGSTSCVSFQPVRLQFCGSPEDGSVEVVCVRAVDGVQVAGGGQLGSELAPGHLQDLVGDVALDHLDEVLHLVSVELKLPELHRAAGAFHQSWGGNQTKDLKI